MRVTARSLKSSLFCDWEQPDTETILKRATEALKHPQDAVFWDEDVYSTHTLMFYSAPASDDMISQSNHRTILRDLSAAYKRSPRAIESSSIRHWTYSHFDCIKVQVTYVNGDIHPAFVDALTIALKLDDYPLWDESDYSELETAEWDRAITDAVDWALRNEDDADEIRAAVTEYLYSDSAELIGYHDVGYVPDETMDAGIAYAREILAQAESVGLTQIHEIPDFLPCGCASTQPDHTCGPSA